jgi:hypothetical protein
MNRGNYIFSGLFLLASAVCGYFAARWIEPSIMERLWNGDSVQWQSIGSPPGGASRIISTGQEYNTREIAVLAINGRAYHCCDQTALVWEEAEHNQPQPRLACGALTAFPTANPPGKIVDCAEISNWEPATSKTIFVVLEDGTVWRWHLDVFLLTPLIIQFVCGPLIGLIMGMSLLCLWGKVREASPTEHNTIILSR